MTCNMARLTPKNANNSFFDEPPPDPPPPLFGWPPSVLGAITQSGKDDILDRAAREVGNVLKDNLYNRFMATDQCKKIQEQVAAVEHCREGYSAIQG